jgi:hypothetical protein
MRLTDGGELVSCAAGCQLAKEYGPDLEHAGECDGRPESERWGDLFRLIDEGCLDAELTQRMERMGVEALPS